MTTETEKKRSIGQRISAITEAVGQVKATGKNAQGVIALSNEDIEDSLRPLVAKHGVVTKWNLVRGESFQEPTRNGTMTLWRLDFRVRIECDDDPADGFEADWFDIGGSPAAAESFAVKGYYKRLFHIASADDERQAPRERERERQADPEPRQQEQQVAKDPLEGLPAGFTAGQWAEVKALATRVKAAATAEAWTEAGLNSPARVKARILSLHALPVGDFTDDSRAAYALETIKGELEALLPPQGEPGATGRAPSPSGGSSGAGALSMAASANLAARESEPTADEAEALRVAVAASG